MHFGTTLIQRSNEGPDRVGEFPVINLLCPGTNGEISFLALTPDGGTFAKPSGYYYSPFRLISEEQKKKRSTHILIIYYIIK